MTVTHDAKAALDSAVAHYDFGVFPGDESEATTEELRPMAKAVLLAFLDHMSRHYSGDMEVESASGHLARMVRDA